MGDNRFHDRGKSGNCPTAEIVTIAKATRHDYYIYIL